MLVYPSEYAGNEPGHRRLVGRGGRLRLDRPGPRTKGVNFEHYDDLPETTREGDVHIMDAYKAVWFKDPDGNILNLFNIAMP